jgi:hypothetical protein
MGRVVGPAEHDRYAGISPVTKRHAQGTDDGVQE